MLALQKTGNLARVYPTSQPMTDRIDYNLSWIGKVDGWIYQKKNLLESNPMTDLCPSTI